MKSTNKSSMIPFILMACAVAVAIYFTPPSSFRIRWNDETLYFTVAKNIHFEGDFNSHHYLSESLLRKGYPTKDTHPPGYPLLIALSFLFFGVGEGAPYWLNYLLLAATAGLLFLMGRELRSAWVGTLGGLLFLLSPLTLPLTQSIMSEISAGFAVTLVFFLLVLLEESYLKGILLALAIALATLIKPFLLILLPACFLDGWLRPRDRRPATLLALSVAFALLAILVVFPLSSNREYYPSSINDLFLQAGISAKLQYGWDNFLKNLRQTWALPWKSGELGALGLCLGYLIFATATMKRPASDRRFALVAAVAFSFLATLLAVFLIYEYPLWRGARALFAFVPVLSLLFAVAAAQFKPRWLGLGICLLFISASAYYSKATFNALESSKRRQEGVLVQRFERSRNNLMRLGLKPRVLLSANNLYFPVGAYPSLVLWSEPRNLEEFSRIEAVLAPDVLEIPAKSPLSRSNLRANGPAKFGENYELAGEGDGYYYYRRSSPRQP